MAPGEMKNVPGAAAAQMEAEFVLELVLEAGRLCDRIITFLGKRAKGRPAKPVPKMEFPKRFEKRVEIIWRALCACGTYQPGTILLYTHVIGKLVQWADELSITHLDWRGVEQFLHYYVQQRRPRGTEDLCKPSGDGLGVRYVAFYAVKAVLDSLCGLNLTTGMRPPPHPAPVDPASAAACRALYAEVNSDREQMLLLLTNGVGLRPSETAALGWMDFEPGFSGVTVQRQGKAVILEIPGQVTPVLAECRLRCLEHTYVFQSCRGVSPVPVGVRSLQYVLARLVKRCDLEDRVTLTMLRKASFPIPDRPGPRPPPSPRDDGDCPASPPPEAPGIPCAAAQDADSAADLELLAKAPPGLVALRRQFVPVTARCGTVWAAMAFARQRAHYGSESAPDCYVASDFAEAVGGGNSLTPQCTEGVHERPMPRPVSHGPTFRFPVLARSA